MNSGVRLEPARQAPFDVINEEGRSHALITCDHASSSTPEALGLLGLSPSRFAEHIAHDIGARALSVGLSQRLDACAVIARFSRLVVDLNRFPGALGSIPEVSDGVRVPGNEGLSASGRDARYRDIFWPYHREIAGRIDRLCERGRQPLVIAVHTFTPLMNGQARPWHIGVLSNADRRVSDRLLHSLRADKTLCVGDNEPYSAMDPFGYSFVTHCQDRALPHALFEVRQDLVADPKGVCRWVTILEHALRSSGVFGEHARPMASDFGPRVLPG